MHVADVCRANLGNEALRLSKGQSFDFERVFPLQMRLSWAGGGNSKWLKIQFPKSRKSLNVSKSYVLNHLLTRLKNVFVHSPDTFLEEGFSGETSFGPAKPKTLV